MYIKNTGEKKKVSKLCLILKNQIIFIVYFCQYKINLPFN